jgi:SAM-dependent methyltransferase
MSFLTRIPSFVWKKANDALLGIDTLTLPSEKPNGPAPTAFGDSYAYSSPDYADLRRVISKLSLCETDVVYDLGCGLGRFVCLAARQRVAGVVGVEINAALLENCRVNVRNLRGRLAPIELLRQDASRTDLSSGTVFFLFNPFGPSTFDAMLANLQGSLTTNPRLIQLVYVNPQSGHKSVLEKNPFLSLGCALRSLHGLEILFLNNDNAR